MEILRAGSLGRKTREAATIFSFPGKIERETADGIEKQERSDGNEPDAEPGITAKRDEPAEKKSAGNENGRPDQAEGS